MRQKTLAWLAVFVTALEMTGCAQTFTTLRSFGVFTNITGYRPESALAQGPDGTLYGCTTSGEGPVNGTVFKIQPDDSGFAVLMWFTNSADGTLLKGGLTLDGNVLYGTATEG